VSIGKTSALLILLLGEGSAERTIRSPDNKAYKLAVRTIGRQE